jgi:DNA-binding MarR family transcriptional regulator
MSTLSNHITPDPLETQADAWTREWPGQDRHTWLIGRRLLLLGAHVQTALKEAAASEGLLGTELLLLDALMLSGPPYTLTPTQLQASLMLTKGGVTKCITRLEAMELVQRLPDPQDGRGVLVKMMPSARTLLRRIVKTGNVGVDWIASNNLPPKRRAQLSDLLREMLQLANTEAARREARDED